MVTVEETMVSFRRDVKTEKDAMALLRERKVLPSSMKCSLEGYVHQKVNHSENFVDPQTGAHTQGMERAWLEAKDGYKRAR